MRLSCFFHIHFISPYLSLTHSPLSIIFALYKHLSFTFHLLSAYHI
nr:MAG TPA: hypothetical protein [Caudoviricetes sp.]